VAPAHVALLHELITLDSGTGWRFEGKTGSGDDAGVQVAWLVGYATRGERRWIYAFLERAAMNEASMSREARVAEVERRLRARGILPAQ
jgi:beta-lactamase class D